jgi:hypothetical protein
MKITLKLSEKQLGALVYSFNEIPGVRPKERIQKVAKSVLDKVALKIRKKHLEVKAEYNLFNKDKKYSVSMELVEAHFLEQFLVVMGNYPMCEYDKNAILQIASKLNQQLA